MNKQRSQAEVIAIRIGTLILAALASCLLFVVGRELWLARQAWVAPLPTTTTTGPAPLSDVLGAGFAGGIAVALFHLSDAIERWRKGRR